MRRSRDAAGAAVRPEVLADGAVDLWYGTFSDLATLIPNPEAVLSDDERCRADRFHFEKDRTPYVLGRGFLRHIAGLYLGQSPQSLRFQYGEFGKPALEGNLHFNVSHSGERALMAFGRGRRLGVDIEKIDWKIDVLEIATGFFSDREVADLRLLEGRDRQRAFFRCWARKEAFLKGLGDGLSQPLSDFDVSIRDVEPAGLTRVAWDPAAPQRWQIRELDIDPDYMSAVAVEGFGWEPRIRHAREAFNAGLSAPGKTSA
ncbi:MAG TPA: 4'-phosphopantetheinyl transferase superfamily protein [Capsulimonadaceae bacterium]|nr:4'-phosphopantetheinyl transferase superfamily protein [Capsulimonadaceae bacterium]